MKTFFNLIRIKHWVKNTFIIAPLIFSLKLFDLTKLTKSIIAFFSFSFVASLVYIINDIKDKENDAQHSIKSERPIASGRVKPLFALLLGIFMALIGFISSFYFLGFISSIIILLYFFINVSYSFFLKKIAILDVFIIAVGFCIRVLLGAASIEVRLSNWMLLATFAISLIIGFGKRRHELEILGTEAVNHRDNLGDYNKKFLDIMIIISTALTAISYALYTMDQDVIAFFKVKTLIFTVPFVLFGLFRYLFLIYCKGKGGSPVDLVIKDPGIIISVILWLLVILIMIYYRNIYDLLNIDLDIIENLKSYLINK